MNAVPQLALADELARLPDSEREKILSELTDEEAEAILWDWTFWQRPNQAEPEGSDWFVWLILAGRGFGKTRTGAEWVRSNVATGNYGRITLVGETAADVRDIMIDGESGILAISPPGERPIWTPSRRRLVWPNGAVGLTFSADEPDQLRGPQSDLAWCDEFAKWKYPDLAWDNLMFGLRLGDHPKVCVTTTPKPLKILRALLKMKDVATTIASTYENIANLSRVFYEKVIKPYEGTRKGEQELNARIMEDAEGALWKRGEIDLNRVAERFNDRAAVDGDDGDEWTPLSRVERAKRIAERFDLISVVVAIDPATTSKAETSDDTGIAVVGRGRNGHGYILEDLSGIYTPAEWADVAIKAFDEWQADRIIGETNNGGEMIEHTLSTRRKNIPYKGVWASRGKRTRAEPISSYAEKGEIHHVGTFADLEDEMCSWEPDKGQRSPSRVDAVVWGMTELLLGGPTMEDFNEDDILIVSNSDVDKAGSPFAHMAQSQQYEDEDGDDHGPKPLPI